MARKSAPVVNGSRRTSASDLMSLRLNSQLGELLLVKGHPLRHALNRVLQSAELQLLRVPGGPMFQILDPRTCF